MKFGYGPLCAQTPADTDQSPEETYKEMVSLAEVAEESGFDSVYLGEHHFWDDGYLPYSLVVAAAIADATTDIEIRTGIVIGPLHDPIRLAEKAAVVHLLSGGRFQLGLGLCWRDEEYRVFDVPKR